jgi:quinol monooxygenase YgiN
MIHVIATVELHPETREQFLREFRNVAPKVRGEEGCLGYEGTIDLASGLSAQGPIRPDVVTIVERWSGLPVLSAHLTAPHMKVYRERIKPFVQRTTLQVLEPVVEPVP